MLGAARLYAPGLQGRRALLLPAGALVYIAVPPARDFATSGLESRPGAGLSGPAVVDAGLLVAGAAHAAVPGPRRLVHRVPWRSWPGCSVLVRPELALIGGGALIMLLIAARDWRPRALIVVAGGALPVAYQIFRMGYYALLVPGTALAKDAAGDKWSQGMIYLANFNAPYALWVPARAAGGAGCGAVGRRRGAPSAHAARRRAVSAGGPGWCKARRRWSVFFVVSGLLQALYWIRQGGDFMHGRVLLAPLFCMLAPVAVIPVLLPDGARYHREAGYPLSGAVGAAVAGGGGLGAVGGQLARDGRRRHPRHLLRHRRRAPVLLAGDRPRPPADRRGLPRAIRGCARCWPRIDATPDGALLLPSGNYDQWDVVPVILPPPPGSAFRPIPTRAEPDRTPSSSPTWACWA